MFNCGNESVINDTKVAEKCRWAITYAAAVGRWRSDQCDGVLISAGVPLYTYIRDRLYRLLSTDLRKIRLAMDLRNETAA
jgi:hypothetical protein